MILQQTFEYYDVDSVLLWSRSSCSSWEESAKDAWENRVRRFTALPARWRPTYEANRRDLSIRIEEPARVEGLSQVTFLQYKDSDLPVPESVAR